jgi:hypothetical protein
MALAAVAVLLRDPVTRLLARPRVWAVVVAVGSVAMTAFLWHLTALFVAVLALRRLGIDPPEALGGTWWATRPPWLLVLAGLTVALVAVFRRFDPIRRSVTRTHTSGGADLRAAFGTALAVLGVLMVSVTGVDVLGSTTVRFVVLDITPGTASTVLAAGLAVLILDRFRTRRPTEDQAASVLADAPGPILH